MRASTSPLLLAAFVALLPCLAAADGEHTGAGGGDVASQCQSNGRSCDATADRYQHGGTVTTRAEGSEQTYHRNSSGSAPSLTGNVVSAPYVLYMRNVNASLATGPTGTGTGSGTDCQYGQELAHGSCRFGVQSGGAAGDARTVLSYTRAGGAWFEGAGSATCTASGWTFTSPPTCTPTSNPGTSCGGCAHDAATGWRCTFCD